jgi:hypothetical protein
VTEASELLCKLSRRCRYRCHQHNALTAFPPFFLLLNPVQSVLAHWTSRDIKAPNESNADPFKPHWLEAYSLSGSIGKMGESLQTRVRDQCPRRRPADPLQFRIKVLLRS